MASKGRNGSVHLETPALPVYPVVRPFAALFCRFLCSSSCEGKLSSSVSVGCHAFSASSMQGTHRVV